MLYKEKIVYLRNRLGMTQKDIADILNVDSKHYGNCEREYEILPIKHLSSLSNYFNVSLDYIFGFTDKMNYKNNSNEIDKKISGQRLKDFRKEKKITQVKLADTLNTVHTVIYNYERGRTIISTPFLYTICKKYNISADYLLGKTNEPKYLK